MRGFQIWQQSAQRWRRRPGLLLAALGVLSCRPAPPPAAPPTPISFMSAPAAGEVVGLVLEAGTAKGLPRVLVTLEGTEPRRGVETDSSGHFRLRRVPPGEYTLLVRAIGYVHRRLPLVVPEGRGVAAVVSLEPSPPLRAKVKVTATARAQPPT